MRALQADEVHTATGMAAWRKVWTGEVREVSQTFASWNLIGKWLRRLDTLRQAA
jgi:hypothetical protein